MIFCIFIDEIGLCELSPANPLKALHTYLELGYKNQNLEKKFAFVGISNWKLDAAKMNRGIFLNVLNPISDFKQMKETGFQIADFYDNSFSYFHKELLENLTNVIFEYNIYLKKINDNQIFFHGTRDFYNLIKTVTKKIRDSDFEDKPDINSALFAIECNYNGISRNNENSSDYIKKQFKKIYPEAQEIPDFGIVKCIKNNLTDDDSRYLLLITKSNLSHYLVLNIIKDVREENKIIYYLGSLFEDDIFNEAYSAKTINKIKYYLEHDIILVLKNLSTTYASLYDLFNQRFSYIKNKKYAEISLGEVSNSTYVNDNLKIIVLIREEMVKEQDPPFLNRFEKYFASFDNILDRNSKNMAKIILEYKKLLFKKITSDSNEKKIKIKYNFENELINFYEEEIKSLICDYLIKSEKTEELGKEEVFDMIFEKISKTFSQELIAYLNHYRKKEYLNEVNKINNYYNNSIHSNLESYIKKTAKSMNVIYTFTPTVRSTKFNFEIEKEKIGIINGENIKNVYINLIKAERQLEIEVIDFYESENKLLVINMEESDSQNLEYVLMFLQRFEKEKSEEEKKLIIILIHLNRKKEPYNLDIFVPNLSGIEQTFIDNLNGRDALISNIMNQSIRDLYKNINLIDVHEIFENELFCCFQKIEYCFEYKNTEQNKYVENIIDFILKNENLINIIIERILDEIVQAHENTSEENEIIPENKKDKLNVFDYIFENNTFESDLDFITILSNELKQNFIKYFNKFIINSEKLGILSSLSKDLPESAQEIWEKLLNEFDFSREIINNLKSNKIKVWTKLNLPSIKSIDYIKKIIESDTNQYIEKYLEEEKDIRDCIEPGNIIQNDEENEEDEEDYKEKKELMNEFFLEENNINDPKYKKIKEDLKKFFIPKNQVVNYIKKHLEKDHFIKSFREENKEELLELFFKDYYSQIITFLIQNEDKDNFYYNLLIYLTYLRFGEKPKENSLEYYSKSILWIHIYRDEFIFLLKNFGLIKEYFPDILEKVKEKIDSKEINYIISPHNPRHKKLIDKPFLLILDSFFYNLIEIIHEMNSPRVLELMNILSEIVQNGEIYNSNLGLKSKDFYRFKTLFILIKLLNEKHIYNKDDINEYITYIKNERAMLLQNKSDLLVEEVKKQINLLLKILPDCEEKTNTIMKILISKYKEITDIKCREMLCGIIVEDNNLIKLSNEFFILILDSLSFTPDSLNLENDNSDNPISNSVVENKNYPLLKIIDENGSSKILSENLKYIFKFKISQYYNEELNKENINEENQENIIKKEIDTYLGKDSLIYFINAHNILMEIRNRNDEIINKNIKILFCLVYSNFFLEKFVYYLTSQKILVSDSRVQIINFLKGPSDVIKETYKLFILKELKTKYILERTEFLNIEKWSEEYQLNDLYKDFKFEKNKSKKQLQGSLENLFFSGYELDELKNEEQIIILTSSFIGRNLSEKDFLCDIDIFINQYISTLKTEEGMHHCNNSKSMKSFNDYVKNSSKYSNSTKKLIELFFDREEYRNKLSETIKETSYFEILLYAYKFSILCSLSNHNSIFFKMICENWVENINNSYIPGADLFCDLWVESYLNMKKPISQNHTNGYCVGYYICDCGEYYYQQFCGVPIDINFCANCHKKIGGLNEKLIIREEDNGVYKIKRIYPDEKNKNDVEARYDLKRIYGENFENGYPYELFKDFENRIKEEMNKDYKGIYEQSYLFFINETKSIRKMSQITYRLLNFIIYSNLYFSLKCGFITLKEINENKYIPIKEEPYNGFYNEEDSYNDYRSVLLDKRKKGISADKDILEILQINWILLEKQLKENNVNNIQIFINTIITDLFLYFGNKNDFSTPEERNEFENEIDTFIDNYIKNYEVNSQTYLKNIEALTSNNLEIEYIILERENIMANVERKYPYYYELLSIPLVKEENIKELLKSIENVEKKYPVLWSYLNIDKKEIEYLQTFSQINNFVNYTIEHYSNAISRDEAKKRKINGELDKNIPINLFNEFLKAFNNHELYKIANQYDCHILKFDLRKFSREDYLSNFLIDNGVLDYGMQLAALYQKYIQYQNSFLDNVIYNIPKGNNFFKGAEKLGYLREKIKEEINPQKANKYNVISFDITTENYNSFLEMVLFYSFKDSFNDKFEFDFLKKDKIKFNLDDIEEQLEYLILPGKKKFSSKLDFVIYQFEGFRNQNSSILSTFIEKYPQKTLNEEEKKILYDFNCDQYSIEIKMKILFSIQLMITFYNDFPNSDENTIVSDTINDFPSYFKIPEETRNLFNNPFTISQIISVYEYFELLCFSEIKNNIDPSYKMELSEEKKKRIEEYFNINENSFINRLVLSSTVRKFISRSLVGIREDLEIKYDIELFSVLIYKEDCWNKEIFNNYQFEKTIEKLKELDIKVGEVLNLYDVLGGDSILLGEAVKHKVEEKKAEEKDKKEKNKKGKKKKGKKGIF